MIISVGYRGNSYRGVQFRIWATQILREYLIKGSAMNDDRLKRAGGGNYFDELLNRIRDIRSSEKVFYRKVLEIYALSIDYDPRTEVTQMFFKTVQNKMHFSAHGHTAAEVIYQRADANKDFIGLTSWTGGLPKRTDTEIAKNYLSPEELDTQNRIVSLYLDFAELQAQSHKPMYMNDWIQKLDNFLKLFGKELKNMNLFATILRSLNVFYRGFNSLNLLYLSDSFNASVLFDIHLVFHSIINAKSV